MVDKRPPARAGQFYPGSEAALRNKIEDSFEHELGFGEVPELGGGGRKIRGVVVPHAGYDFSGPVASHVYGSLAEDGYPDVFIILGPHHSDPFRTGSLPDAAITKKTFQMPFGEVPVDQGLADELLGGAIEEDPDMHASEHSIEVQLPFLQYFDADISFVPICVSSQDLGTAEKIGESIREATRGKDVVIIASTDFTHCGPNYNQIPPGGMDAGEFAEEKDEGAIELIEEMDAEGLSDYVKKEDLTMCGPGGVMATILALEDRVKGGELLKYSTSADVMPGRNAVGYGGIVFR